jgi:hypothetical protein
MGQNNLEWRWTLGKGCVGLGGLAWAEFGEIIGINIFDFLAIDLNRFK